MNVLYEKEEINKAKLKFSHGLGLTKLFNFMYYFLECRNYTLFFQQPSCLSTTHKVHV